ncbi:MAG: F0F1 ATP synthase subunit B [Chloroflexi bacterium]|nr:F0F1 ATP synthase subunit B [Chloroflexota bacterium]
MIYPIAATIPIYLDLTIIVQVILFLLFLALLNVVFYQPLAKIFRERDARVEAGQRAAEESRRLSEETQREVRSQLDAARVEAQGVIGAATKDAAAQRQALMEQAQAQANTLIEQARQEIRSERDAVLDQLRRETSALAILVASRVAGRSLDNAANREVAESAVAAGSGIA